MTAIVAFESLDCPVLVGDILVSSSTLGANLSAIPSCTNLSRLALVLAARGQAIRTAVGERYPRQRAPADKNLIIAAQVKPMVDEANLLRHSALVHQVVCGVCGRLLEQLPGEANGSSGGAELGAPTQESHE